MKDLNMVFIDLENHKAPREFYGGIWKLEVFMWHIFGDMTRVRAMEGVSEHFPIKMGLH